MENINQPEVWRAIFVMLGSAAAGLVGLLFIVMSFHLDEIKKHPDNIVPARNNTLHLLTVLVEAVLVLAPQPLFILGAELVAINLFGLRLPVGITYRYFRKNIGFNFRGGFPIYTIVTIIGAYLLGIAGGIGLIEHANWALYLVTASLLILVVRSILTAWNIMFGAHFD